MLALKIFVLERLADAEIYELLVIFVWKVKNEE